MPPSSTAVRLLVLHGLRLKGLAEAPALAERAGIAAADVDATLDAARRDGLAVHRDGRVSGWVLTAPGRAEAAKLVADEVDADTRGDVEAAYRRFLAVNAALLALCTDWQMIDDQTANDHSDPAYDESVIARLGDVDDQVQPVCADLGRRLDRFARYGARLATARRRVIAGDTEWFTRPTVDSYHSVWFELHEDLLTTLGLERSNEAAS